MVGDIWFLLLPMAHAASFSGGESVGCLWSLGNIPVRAQGNMAFRGHHWVLFIPKTYINTYVTTQPAPTLGILTFALIRATCHAFCGGCGWARFLTFCLSTIVGILGWNDHFDIFGSRQPKNRWIQQLVFLEASCDQWKWFHVSVNCLTLCWIIAGIMRPRTTISVLWQSCTANLVVRLFAEQMDYAMSRLFNFWACPGCYQWGPVVNSLVFVSPGGTLLLQAWVWQWMAWIWMTCLNGFHIDRPPTWMVSVLSHHIVVIQ